MGCGEPTDADQGSFYPLDQDGSTPGTEWPLGGVRALSQRGDRVGRLLGGAGKAEGLTWRTCAFREMTGWQCNVLHSG